MGAFPFYSIIVTQSYGIVNKNRQQFKISLKSDNKYFYSDKNWRLCFYVKKTIENIFLYGIIIFVWGVLWMKEKYYIAVNTGEKYPLLKDTLNYTEFFSEAMVFNDIVAVYEYIERHGLEKLATVIKA